MFEFIDEEDSILHITPPHHEQITPSSKQTEPRSEEELQSVPRSDPFKWLAVCSKRSPASSDPARRTRHARLFIPSCPSRPALMVIDA